MGDVEMKTEELQGGWERTVKDLSSGAAGGIAQVLIGKVKFLIPVHRSRFVLLLRSRSTGNGEWS